MLSRRSLLVTGGAAAVVAGIGVTGYVHGPGTAPAREPWNQAGESFGDPRLDALAYAILAPNPHNRQPWWFELVDEDRIDVYFDQNRRLPETDPYDRQLTIGFGCMLELLRQAGAEKGYQVTVDPFPDGQPQPVLNGNRMAQVTFRRDGSVVPDPLFQSVLARRSTKEPFDTSRAVSSQTLNSVLNAAQSNLKVDGTVSADEINAITELAWQGWLIEYDTDRTRRESIDLMRFGNRAIAKNPDGIDMGGLSMGLMNVAGIVTPESLDKKGSQAYQTGIDMYEKIIKTAMGHVWIASDENSRASQLEAGGAWVRLNLAAQREGLCIHPLSQILQEFPEMAEPYGAIREKLGAPSGGAVQMLGRIGYTNFPAASPRWPLESRLMNGTA
ncbi:MAG: twin-arginine translocation pathway signal protein [Pseudomonadota bacterium]